MNNFFFVKTNRNDLVGSFFLTLYHTHPQPPLLSYVIKRGGTISPARARFEIVYLWRLFSLFFFFLSKRDSRTCSASATIHTDTRVSPSRMSVLHTEKKTFFIFFALDLFSVAVSTCFTSGRKEKKKSPKKTEKQKNIHRRLYRKRDEATDRVYNKWFLIASSYLFNGF